MQSRVVVIDVYRGRAYLPAQVQFESGIRADVEPVFTAKLTIQDLVSAVEQVLAVGQPRLPDPTRDEWENRQDPVLRATKARDWRALARSGASYAIAFTEKYIRLDVSRQDEKGRWQFDRTKVRTFPPDTLLREIMPVILEDIQSRPEVL